MTDEPRTQPDALWYTRCAVPTPLSLAILQGWIDEEFARDGIAIHSLRESDDPALLASHFDHSLPRSFRQGGSVPAIWAKSRGRDTRVLAISWTDEFQAIVAAPGSDIRTLRDLKGRRVGIPQHRIAIDHNRASSLRAFTVALSLEGLTLDDVERVDLPDPIGTDEVIPTVRRNGHTYRNEALALARGDVDAVYVKDVRGWDLIDLVGATIVTELGFHPDPFVRISNCTPRPLTVDAGTLASYPDLVERFLARVVEAGFWATRHPAETVQRIAEETGWSTRAVRRAFSDKVHLHLTADLADPSIAGLDTFVEFLAANGTIPHRFDAWDWIDPAPLDAVLRRHAQRAA